MGISSIFLLSCCL